MSLPSLTLAEIRANTQARKASAFNPEKYESFDHEYLGTRLFYSGLPPAAAARYDNIEQFYPLDHPKEDLRGQKMSSKALDTTNQNKLLLMECVWTSDGQRLDGDTIQDMMSADGEGDTRDLQLKILEKSFLGRKAGESQNETPGEGNYIQAQTYLDAAFLDLVVQSGALKKLVVWATAKDENTPEAKEALEELKMLEEFAPEWSVKLQARERTRAMLFAAQEERWQREGRNGQN